MMKKVLCILIGALFLLSACSSQNSANSSGSMNTGSQPQVTAAPAETSQAAASLLPEDYNANFRNGRSLVATDGKYTFFIDSSLGYRSELYRIESENDSAPVLIASVDVPSPGNSSDWFFLAPPIAAVFATPEKVYYSAAVYESQQNGQSGPPSHYELICMNKDGTDAQPVKLSLPEYSVAAVDGFKIACVDQLNYEKVVLFDLITMEETDISAFIPSNDSDEYIRTIGIYHDELYCSKDMRNDDITVSQIYAVNIRTGEKRDICTVESPYGVSADCFYDGYLFVEVIEASSSDTIFKSIDLATGKQYLIGRCKANNGNQVLAVSQGTVYYLEDKNAICAVSKTGENNRYAIRDIFTGDEVGFCGIQAVAGWIYYERWMRDVASDGGRGGEYTENFRPCRIRTDGSSGQAAPLIKRP